MSIEDLKTRIPDYAKDIRLNLSSMLQSDALTPAQAAGAAVAAAYAARNADVLRAVVAETGDSLSPEQLTAAKAAGAIMSMNNIYYRSTHQLGGDYGKLPARLRMNVIANHGVDKVDFELWSVAASAINGCGMCLSSHEREVRSKGLSAEAVRDAVRIAAIIHSAAAVIEAEAA